MEDKKIARKTNKSKNRLSGPHKLKLLFTIGDRTKTEFYLDIIEQHNVNLQCVTFGRGTAPNHLRYLGLGDQSKSVIISVVNEDNVKKLLADLEEKFEKTKHGKGIAYTVPIDSVIGVMIYQFLSNSNDKFF